MKLSSFVAISSALSGFVAATPVEKRGVTWVTVTDVVATTVDVVKTVYVNGNGVAAQATGAPAPALNPIPPKHQHHHPKHQHTHHSGSSNNPAPAPPTQHKPKPQPQPQSQPQPATGPAPAPVPNPAPSSSGSSGQTMSGDMTYYAVGLGSCGLTSTPNESIVALSYKLMNNPANPNDNPLCGRTITINYKGITQTAKVVDTCEGCQGIGDLDMSTSLFQKFAPMSVGRVTSGMSWHFD